MTNRFFYPHSNDTDANRSKNHPARKPAVPSFLKIGTAEKRNAYAIFTFLIKLFKPN